MCFNTKGEDGSLNKVTSKYERLKDLSYFCGILGHLEKTCWKKIEWLAEKKNTEVTAPSFGPWMRADVSVPKWSPGPSTRGKGSFEWNKHRAELKGKVYWVENEGTEQDARGEKVGEAHAPRAIMNREFLKVVEDSTEGFNAKQIQAATAESNPFIAQKQSPGANSLQLLLTAAHDKTLYSHSNVVPATRNLEDRDFEERRKAAAVTFFFFFLFCL